ncbi:MAG: exo-alpha-sialidase, partial [Gemmatimonadetes bacterium]|nr:exo-alpha-sialidase [Gemmatimonadota bacterium]
MVRNRMGVAESAAAKALLRGALLALVGTPTLVHAQITVGGNVQVSTDMAQAPHYEHLAGADPARPGRMLACAMVTRPGESKVLGVVYASADAGRSWRRTFVSESASVTADPECAFGLGDTAYFAVLSIDDPRRNTLVYRSPDAGLTWDTVPVSLPFTDREYVVADRTGGRYHGRVYLNGTGTVQGLGGENMPALTLYRSLDGGASFNGPAQRPGLPPSHVTGMGNSVVLSDGTVVTLFGHAARRADLRDEQNPLTQPNATLKVGISRDGGESVAEVVTVGDWYMARERSQSSHIPRLAVDASRGPFRDRLYAVWNDLRMQRLEVLLAWSGDGGRSWSKPVRVVRDDRIRPDPRLGPD